MYGEQFHRAAYALAAITGNVGIVGGNSGTSNGATGRAGIGSLPIGKNPIDARVSTPLLADLLARGKAGGYPADIKLIYSAGGGLFNQAPNAGKMAASLDGVEFIVGQDHFLTPTVRMADIVLPATTFWERNDVHVPWSGAGHYAIYMRQAIEPMYECRNDIDIFEDLARRVGINGYNTKSEAEWLREFTSQSITINTILCCQWSGCDSPTAELKRTIKPMGNQASAGGKGSAAVASSLPTFI